VLLISNFCVCVCEGWEAELACHVCVCYCSESVESCEKWANSTTQQVDLAFNVFFMIYFFIRVIFHTPLAHQSSRNNILQVETPLESQLRQVFFLSFILLSLSLIYRSYCCTVTQYDRLSASSCRLFVRLSLCLSVA